MVQPPPPPSHAPKKEMLRLQYGIPCELRFWGVVESLAAKSVSRGESGTKTQAHVRFGAPLPQLPAGTT